MKVLVFLDSMRFGGHPLDELRIGFIDLRDDGECDGLALLFEFVGQARRGSPLPE